MRALIPSYLCMCLLVGCGDSDKQKVEPDFTLSKGVSVVTFESCNKSDPAKDIIIKRDSNAYVVAVEGAFSCEIDQPQPYLTLTVNRRATLVIPKKATSTGFKSNCECNRSLSVRIEGRVERGDSLYVLHDSEVWGHVVVP